MAGVVSIRLRILALVVLAVTGATAATAWLTLRQATHQITASAEAHREAKAQVAALLWEYVQVHGTWEGVAAVVAELAATTGHRIRLVTWFDEVIVDTDHLDGRQARETIGTPAPINIQQHVLAYRTSFTAPSTVNATVHEFRRYRREVLLRACLTRHGEPPPPVTDLWRGPLPVTPADLAQADVDIWRDCLAWADQYEPQPLTIARFEACETYPEGDRASCLQEAFNHESSAFAPAPAYLYLGAVEQASPLTAGPVVAVAAVVGVLAAGGALLVTRRLLRPVGALTAAARRLGTGDLSERVPVDGSDELAALARTFNHMAASLQRAEVRQRRLAADVAHELRTPLANLRGYLEALQDGVIDPDPDLLASLHDEVMLQQRIVDDLQDLAQAEAGSLAYHPATVDLGELMETCRIAHQAAADAGGVTLSVRAPEKLTVTADPDRLRQVLGNLVSNALRATGEGGEIRLSASRQYHHAVVTVTDNGHGIAAEELPYVFDRFWRADAARARGTGGSGLGLAIARQIVTDHGGTISARSRPGEETTFTIILPITAGTLPVTPRRRAGRPARSRPARSRPVGGDAPPSPPEQRVQLLARSAPGAGSPPVPPGTDGACSGSGPAAGSTGTGGGGSTRPACR